MDLHAIDVSPNTQWLAVGTADGSVLLWEGRALADCVAANDLVDLPAPMCLRPELREGSLSENLLSAQVVTWPLSRRKGCTTWRSIPIHTRQQGWR